MYMQVNSPMARPPSRRSVPPDSPPAMSHGPETELGTTALMSTTTKPLDNSPHPRRKTPSPESAISRRSRNSSLSNRTKNHHSSTNNVVSSSSPETLTTRALVSGASPSSQRRTAKSSPPPESPRNTNRASPSPEHGNSRRVFDSPPSPAASDSTPKTQNSTRRLNLGLVDFQNMAAASRRPSGSGRSVRSMTDTTTIAQIFPKRKSISHSMNHSSKGVASSPGASPPATPKQLDLKRRVTTPPDLDSVVMPPPLPLTSSKSSTTSKTTTFNERLSSSPPFASLRSFGTKSSSKTSTLPADLDALRRASLRSVSNRSTTKTTTTAPLSESTLFKNYASSKKRNNSQSLVHSTQKDTTTTSVTNNVNNKAKAKVSKQPQNQDTDNKSKPMTLVYQHARNQDWDEMIYQCRLHPHEAKYKNPQDGTTALHVAVMSRTGYASPEQEKQKQQEQLEEQHNQTEKPAAPLTIIEELLQLCPDAARVVCKLYSYTPLAYACLVSGDEWNLEDSAAMVRIFLKHASDSLSIFTEGGLSALDVHIISFSYKNREQQVEDNILSGRTSTVVLRTLLEADPCLAHVRIRKDKVGGPVELLYRCNSSSFMDAVDLDDKAYMKKKSNASSAESKNERSVIATITNWWVWKWTILLLKYGTVTYKKKGAPFLAVQAAAAMVGCPLPVLTLALKAFPKQIRQRDAMQGVKGNLPLHEVATWPCQQDSESTEPVISSRKGMAISALLQEYPDAAKVTNNLNQSPLELAVASGTTWDGGVRKLVRAHPSAVRQVSQITGLAPFLAAAAAAFGFGPVQSEPSALSSASSRRSIAMHQKVVAKRDLQSIRTIYGLLRADPSVLSKLFVFDTQHENDEEESE